MKLQEFEEIKTVNDYYEHINNIMDCGVETLSDEDNKMTKKIESNFASMVAMLTKGLKKKLKYVLKESAKYTKRPGILERIKEMQIEKEERREEREQRKMLEQEEYRAFLEWREQLEESEENEEESTNLPAIREVKIPEVVNEGEEQEEEEEDEEE